VFFCDKCLTEKIHYGHWYESENVFLKNTLKDKYRLKENVERFQKELNEAKSRIQMITSLFVKRWDEKVNS